MTLIPAGCYKDLSTEATKSIPEIVITGLAQEMSVVYGEEIHVAVNAYMGEKSADDFEYLWEIDLSAESSSNRVELGDGPSLDYKVTNTPSSRSYTLSVRVTDPETGLSGYRSCFIHVGSSLGEGLIVAYTLPDGHSSEFDIVASPAVTYGYTGQPRVTRGLYALANGGDPYPEKVTCVLQTMDTQNHVYDSRRILVGSENHVVAIDPLTFTTREKDAQLFSTSTITEFGPSAMFNCSGYTSYILINGTAYAHICSIDNVYAKIPVSADNPIILTPYNVAYNCLDQGRMTVFNESDGFYRILGYQLNGGGFSSVDVTGSLDFPLEGARSIMGGCFKEARPAYLIKDRNGLYHVAIMILGTMYDNFYSVPFEGERIEEAVSIAFCDNGDLFYYATPDAIYATLISGNTSMVRKLSWKPDNAGERITSVQQYRQAWYGTGQTYPSDYKFTLPTHRSMLIITTYNDATGEGKFYLRGFNVATGMFTFTGDYGTFSGFGEITAIAPTLR